MQVPSSICCCPALVVLGSITVTSPASSLLPQVAAQWVLHSVVDSPETPLLVVHRSLVCLNKSGQRASSPLIHNPHPTSPRTCFHHLLLCCRLLPSSIQPLSHRWIHPDYPGILVSGWCHSLSLTVLNPIILACKAHQAFSSIVR